MLYDYTIVSQTIELKEAIAQASSDQINRALGTQLGLMGQSITQTARHLDGGGWDVLSHDTAMVGRSLVVNFLLRRPARQQ